MKLRAAEFFAGIGLVRAAIEHVGFDVVFANDIEPSKRAIYEANFGGEHFVLDDVRNVLGSAIPNIDLATASFPCTDLSLAGNRLGLSGQQSGMFWEFARILDEMGARRPAVVLLENVLGFATSHGGADIAAAIKRLNELGYTCDIFTLDAKFFLPQSRPRLFIVAAQNLPPTPPISSNALRPAWVRNLLEAHPELNIRAMPLIPPSETKMTIADVIEPMPTTDVRWWKGERLQAFTQSLSAGQAQRLDQMRTASKTTWATAYRRTRNHVAVWEIRADAVSGCLRTARGGSSKQAVVEAGHDKVRVRWMTAREYARLQGVPGFNIDGLSENAAMFGFGDAVCVPVVSWIAREYLRPLLDGTLQVPEFPVGHTSVHRQISFNL